MIRQSIMSALAAPFVLGLVACDTFTGPKSDLQVARARWASHAPASYSYEVTHSCFCLTEAIGPVTVVVRNGVVESRSYTATGLAVSDNFVSIFPGVEGLFAQIDNARTSKAQTLSVAFDSQYGFPTLINVDAKLQVADDEYVYTVKDFVAR